MNMDKEYRLRRIFRDDDRALIVAMDHAYGGGPLKGIEHCDEILEKVVSGGADAILTTYGTLRNFSKVLAGRISTILRLDATPSMFGEQLHRVATVNQVNTVEDALKIGAVGVTTFALMGMPCETDSLRILGRTAVECDKWGMPLAAEALVGLEGGPRKKFRHLSDPALVSAAARIAAEYGADFIKTRYTGSAESFRKVTSTCPVPVLILGGALKGERDVLEDVRGMIEGGGHGVFFGRNIFQSKDPEGMTRALARMIHEDATVEEAIKEVR